MQERLSQFLLQPQTWIPQAKGDIHVGRYYQNQWAPVKTFRSRDYTESLWGRLVLLSDAEWRLLGFGVAVAPFSGKLTKSLNNHLRRALRSRFNEAGIQQLDALSPELLAGTTSHLAPDCWKDVEKVALHGIQGLKTWGAYTPEQTLILEQRFPETTVASTEFNHLLVEELCKILLPTLSWLWQDLPSDSKQDN